MRSFKSSLVIAASLALFPACQKEAEAPKVLEALEAITPVFTQANLSGAASDPADIARYLSASGPQDIALSPSGDSLAYISDVSGARQLYVKTLSSGAIEKLTSGSGVTFFNWAPVSGDLLYGSDNNGNEQESYFLVKASGGEAREVLPAVKGGFRAFGGFSADGRVIAYASTERNGEDFDIYLAGTETWIARRIYEGRWGNFVQAVNEDGSRLILSSSVGEDSDNLYALDTKTGERATISEPTPRANHSDGGMIWKRNLYYATDKDREFTALTQMQFAHGPQAFTLFEPKADVENITDCDDRMAFTTNHDGFDSLHIHDVSPPKPFTDLPALPEGRYRLSCASDGSALAVLVNGWKTPGDVYLWDFKSESVQKIIGSDYAGLNADILVRPISVRIAARDGVELQGLLYLPDASSMKTKALPPVVFNVHGGPTAQSRATYNARAQYFVDRGIAVFETNVRGSTGFGRTYKTLDDQERRRDSVRDLVDMLAGLKAKGLVDTDRAAVSGGSYGGYMVNAVLAEYPQAFKAGVSRYGVADWVTALQIASPALKASDLIEYGNIEEPKWLEFYQNNSPINIADQIEVPVLFSHGEMDSRIDIAETETMVRALRVNNIDAPFIRIPDEGHGWRKRSNQLFYYRAEAEFLETHLAAK